MPESVIKERGAVVVTGASSGIGEACALRLDRRGFQVFAGVRKEKDGKSLKAKASDRLTPIMLDVTDDASIEKAAGSVSEAVGDAGLRGLVNNAGIAVPGPLEFLPLEEMRRQLEVNVIGQIAVTQAFLPLIRAGHGRIVNIGSVGGKIAAPLTGPYHASKFAMEALTDSLRQELRPWGIHVAIIEPGAIDTPLWGKGQAAGDELEARLPQRARELYEDAIAAVRKTAEKSARDGIPPEEVAKAVTHALLSKNPRTRYVVGRDARIGTTIARFVPDRMKDWLIAQQMGLPRGRL